VDDVAQRGHVVFLATSSGSFITDEHGRHHEDGVDPLALDQPQKFLGLEARHQHQRAAKAPARRPNEFGAE
jgi:hypothetical protein